MDWRSNNNLCRQSLQVLGHYFINGYQLYLSRLEFWADLQGEDIVYNGDWSNQLKCSVILFHLQLNLQSSQFLHSSDALFNVTSADPNIQPSSVTYSHTHTEIVNSDNNQEDTIQDMKHDI